MSIVKTAEANQVMTERIRSAIDFVCSETGLEKLDPQVNALVNSAVVYVDTGEYDESREGTYSPTKKGYTDKEREILWPAALYLSRNTEGDEARKRTQAVFRSASNVPDSQRLRVGGGS